MGPPKTFEDLEVWQAAKELAVEVCRLGREGPLAKDYGFKDQLQTTALAVMAAIADGHEQGDSREFLRLLRAGKGLAAKVRSLVHVARDLGYLSDPQRSGLLDRLTSISRQLGGFVRYLEKGPTPAPPKADFVNEPGAAPRRMGAR
jgi:four helix bundle protein